MIDFTKQECDHYILSWYDVKDNADDDAGANGDDGDEAFANGDHDDEGDVEDDACAKGDHGAINQVFCNV